MTCSSWWCISNVEPEMPKHFVAFPFTFWNALNPSVFPNLAPALSSQTRTETFNMKTLAQIVSNITIMESGSKAAVFTRVFLYWCSGRVPDVHTKHWSVSLVLPKWCFRFAWGIDKDPVLYLLTAGCFCCCCGCASLIGWRENVPRLWLAPVLRICTI